MSTNTILATTPLVSTNYLLRATGTTIGNSLIWDNGTNVGIGNTNTSYTLDVSGTFRTTGNAILGGTTTFGSDIFTYNNGGIFFSGGGTYTSGILQNASGLALQSGTAVRMTITSAGNVGIGTSSPSYKLHVSNNTNGFITRFTGGTSSDVNIGIFGSTAGAFGSIGTESNHPFNIFTNGTDRMTITSGGLVGIGTVSPLGTGGTEQTLHLSSGAANYTTLYVTNGANSVKAIVATQSSEGVGIFGMQSNHPALFVTNDTERMRITSGGNVNINGSGFSDVKFYVKGSDATSSNYAALFVNGSASNLFNIRNDGAVQVFGSLSKGSGSFRIDHPLESMTETHQLVHSFIEGPRVDLIYRGKLTLVNGKAQANIDEMATMTEGTFEALCREVQCFTTNESGWDLVKGKVIGNIIYIESQNVNSTDEISWMVIGERKDKHILDTDWTDDNGKVIVEPLKPLKPSEPITN